MDIIQRLEHFETNQLLQGDEYGAEVLNKAVETIGELRDERDALVDAIAIMDEKGRRNPEGNSYMLWEKDWNNLRAILLKAARKEIEDGISR
jgi:hypothetical protein